MCECVRVISKRALLHSFNAIEHYTHGKRIGKSEHSLKTAKCNCNCNGSRSGSTNNNGSSSKVPKQTRKKMKKREKCKCVIIDNQLWWSSHGGRSQPTQLACMCVFLFHSHLQLIWCVVTYRCNSGDQMSYAHLFSSISSFSSPSISLCVYGEKNNAWLRLNGTKWIMWHVCIQQFQRKANWTFHNGQKRRGKNNSSSSTTNCIFICIINT